MKKNIVLLCTAAIMIVFAMTGCGESKEESSGSASSTPTTTPAITTTAPDESKPADTTPTGTDTSAETTADTNETTDTSAPETTDSKPAETTEPTADVTTSPETTTETPAQTDKPQDVSAKAQEIIATAQGLVGKDFTTGGCTVETGFDNSGLIYYVLKTNGIDCPRGLSGQKTFGSPATYDQLKAGDLVFFKNDGADADDAGFGGIYIGDGKMIFSPFPGEKVTVKDVTSTYYKEHFLTAVDLGLAGN